MDARHRSPGNVYRSNSMGMGMGTSRISPNTSARGHGFYNSEYRSFNNRRFGCGQGQPRTFQHPSQLQPLKGDIFMEAGRLAAEYLVSKGLLSQSALPGKWQNGSMKKPLSDNKVFRQQKDFTPEGRTSAHARLGINASDVGSGRRRYSDDFNSKNPLKGTRRGDCSWSYSSEWGREYGRSGSWQDRNKVSPDVEGEDDTFSAHYEEQQVGSDVGDEVQKSGPSGFASENLEADDAELGIEKYNYLHEMDSKACSLCVTKDEIDGEPSKGADDTTDINMNNEEEKDTNNADETEKEIVPEELPTQQSAMETDLSGKNGSDFLTLCKFAKVPTRTRSALKYRASKSEQVRSGEEENVSNIVSPKGSEVLVQDGNLDVAMADVQAKTGVSKCTDSETSKVVSLQSAKDAEELGLTYTFGQDKCTGPQSFPDRSYMDDNEQESNQGLPGFGRSTSVKERGEKRAADENNVDEARKKPREWLPALVSKAEDHSHLSNLHGNKLGSENERTSPNHQVVDNVSQENSVTRHHLLETSSEPCVKCAQEKHLFPGSFKICDLNLMEAADLNVNHSSDQILKYPSIMATKREASQFDVDLSISNANPSGEYTRRTSDGKEIEVINLENDASPENKEFDNAQIKLETSFAGTEGISSHVQNAGDITDVQDNYDGLMISEILNNFSNCTPVTEDITPLQNDMGLHSGEGTLADDDSIYMSLEEIPLSFIPAWEQPPTQKYEKPF